MQTFSILFLWLASATVYYYSFASLTPKDRQVYQQLVEGRSVNRSAAQEPLSYRTQQKRKEVTKQVILADKELHRPQIHLKSQESEMIFRHQNDTMEIIENFQGLSCCMQEELFYGDEPSVPKQRIGAIKADQAVYHYRTSELLAQKVDLSRYCIAGHVMPSSLESFIPLMRSKAEQVELSLGDETPRFKAQGFQAAFQQEESSL